MINTKVLSLSHVVLGVEGERYEAGGKRQAFTCRLPLPVFSPDYLVHMDIKFFQAIPKAALRNTN